ncbi:unnamed protein product [Rhizophagus irregularis]|uniref:Uncharacterized protein n=1 Tax=Rhizophagus irregularis TaxID=588596 RepID=A0A915ZRB1_9GLOM|nr:unnamed protein product [Rhizophagus irregularis]
MSARVLKKEKTSVDKELTKKQAERSELLPEETGSKKPRLMESQQNISILMSEGFMIRVRQHLICLPNLILKKISNAIHKVDARGNSKKDISKATISPMKKPYLCYKKDIKYLCL